MLSYPQVNNIEDLEEIANLLNQTDITQFASQQDLINESEDIIDIVSQNSLKEKEEGSSLKSNIFGLDIINTVPTNIVASTDLPVPGNYKISLNDELKVILTGSENRNYTLKVQLDGSILFPQIGAINLYGKTFDEVKEQINKLINATYVGVEVDVALSNLSAKKINIVGAVENPGTYIVNPFTTISNALAYSGGPKEFGSLRNIRLIRANGQEIIFDMYDLLIEGNRQNDLTISSGDTLIVSGTDNFINISGAVLRPMLYEFKKSDTVRDLVNFALGTKRNANIDNLYLESENASNGIITEKVKLTQLIDDRTPFSLVIGKKASREMKDIFVKGEGVENGYFGIDDYKTLGDLINNLNFSSFVYPYFFVYEYKSIDGTKTNIQYLSVSEKEKLENIKLSPNGVLTFFSKDQILNGSFNAQNYRKIILNFFDESYVIPYYGQLSLKEIEEYFRKDDTSGSVEKIALTFSGEEIRDLGKIISSERIKQITINKKETDLIDITIAGEIARPGRYTVYKGTSLNDIYKIAGGLLETSNPDGIIFQRESLKEKQATAFDKLKKSLYGELLQLAANSRMEGNSDGIGSIPVLFNSMNEVEFYGRFSGELSPESFLAKTTNLEDNDYIFIPTNQYSISIIGEVLNESSVNFSENLTIKDYIEKAGGYSNYAQKSDIYIIRANGLSEPANNSSILRPGDTIIVPRNYTKVEGLPLVTSIAQVLSNLAFTAASINALNN